MSETVAGVILAGGLSRRMGGGDKPLLEIGGRPILDRVIDRLRPQCADLVLNANGDLRRFDGYWLPVVADDLGGHPGPLAGVLAALDWTAAHHPAVEWMASAPGDCPFLPLDLVERLDGARRSAGAEMAIASSGGQQHPVIGLWRVDLRDALRHALVEEGLRKVREWTARHRSTIVEWSAEPVDPFFNVNTPDDLAEAKKLATPSV